MYCKICGSTHNVMFYLDKGMQSLCDKCAPETPDKIGRSEFDQKYWGENYQEVPNSTRKEFYDDYRTSTHTFEEYVIATTERESDLNKTVIY